MPAEETRHHKRDGSRPVASSPTEIPACLWMACSD